MRINYQFKQIIKTFRELEKPPIMAEQTLKFAKVMSTHYSGDSSLQKNPLSNTETIPIVFN